MNSKYQQNFTFTLVNYIAKETTIEAKQFGVIGRGRQTYKVCTLCLPKTSLDINVNSSKVRQRICEATCVAYHYNLR